MTVISQNVCPRVMFTSLKVDYQKELSLTIGDYCKVVNGLDNMLKSKVSHVLPYTPAVMLWERGFFIWKHRKD
jgi:hypothetical protein